MKIYKTAQSVPPGFVDVEIKIDDSGNFKRQIIRGAGGTTCKDGDDKVYLDDILNTNVPGFGEFGEVEDTGRTGEFYEQKAKKTPAAPFKAKPQEQSPYVGGPFGGTPSSKAKEKEMGMGYGV